MPILTQIPIPRLRAGWLLPLLLLCGLRVPLSAQCSLSCNQGLQVSLDPSGQALITPLIIAPNVGNTCPGPLTITLYNQVGQQLPNPLTCAQIGQTVTARVRHTGSGNFCDGTLELFDALSPTISQCTDKFVFCNEDTSPGSMGYPTATDNCTASNGLIFNYLDTETNLGCGSTHNGQSVLKRIDRTWTVRDEHGNSSSCLQRIWLKHIRVSDLVFPPNRDHISAPALVCGQDPEDLSLTGEPTVNGVPVGVALDCEIAVTYTDQTIPHCAPGGFTVLRNWTAIDFCNGTLFNRSQIIRVEDTEAPILTMPADVTVGTDGFYCTGSVELPQAGVSDNCSSVTVVPSWFYGTGFGPFSGVTEGQHLVTYTATDACGNQTTATMTVTVEDTSPPQAICSSDLQVSLSSNGAALVHAATLNAGSYDNCSPVFLSVSRDEIEFFPFIEVNCADQLAPILLTLRVTDAAGLENFCQTEVTVRDFLKPNVQCPPNLSLHCLQDFTDLGLTGVATATDNCALQSVQYQDFTNIQPCNIGSVSRWWTATDSAGNTRSCVQQITLEILSTTVVTFPADASVTNCGDPSSLLPASTGAPVLSGASCSPLSVNYTDQIFSAAAPSCFRIFRSWKVIDHCLYNPNGGSAGVWEHTQLIDIVDNTPPEIILPADLTVSADPFSCQGLVNFPNVVATDCSNQISISHDSPYSTVGSTNNASGAYPLGTHWVTFTATDGCGNAAQQTLQITVLDQTPPTAVCLSGVSVNISVTGQVTLDPSLLDGGSSDFCSPQNSLIFSALPNVFDCQQLGLHPVVLNVQDTAGNMATCSTLVLVQDPSYVCLGGVVHEVEGNIRTETGLPIHHIPVQIAAQGFFEQTNCDTTGNFGFSDLPSDLKYHLTPHNNVKWLNGVTTFDLVLISKHILGLEPLNSPYKMIAADANRSGSITTFDIVQLRKLILGILDTVPNNTSWRFVDSSFVFPTPTNPFASPFPEEIVFNPLISNQFSQSFIGIKVGDLNGNNNPAEARNPTDTLFLKMPDRSCVAGETFVVPLRLERWTDLEGLQFELKIDPTQLELIRVESAQPELLGPSNLALRPDGILALSWDHAEAKPRDAQNLLFHLHLRAKTDCTLHSVLSILDSRLNPEAYLVENQASVALSLQFNPESGLVLESQLELFPNPGSGDFFVKNPAPEEFAQLRILDARGQLVWETEGILPEIIAVQGKTSGSSGFYWVVLQHASGKTIGKLVISND